MKADRIGEECIAHAIDKKLRRTRNSHRIDRRIILKCISKYDIKIRTAFLFLRNGTEFRAIPVRSVFAILALLY
jgi:hypothetical protein